MRLVTRSGLCPKVGENARETPYATARSCSAPLPEGDLDDYLLSNINRWRDQLSLGPLVKEELSRHMETASLDGELPLYLVDFEGQGMGRMTGMPPMASGPGPAAGSSAGRPAAGRPTGERSPGASGEGVGGSTSPSGSPESEIAYEAPSHWKDMGAGGFRQASFRVDEGEDSAEVTVIALGPNSGSVLENVNRWRQQVKLEPLATSQLDGETQLIDAQNSQGTYVVLHGSGGGDKPESILGVILPREDRVWFVKMTGSTPLVEREQAQFESFTRSLRLP
jgi:hypothetical protein